MRPTRPATADEALAARDKVRQRIAELEPELARLRAESRALSKQYKAARLAAWRAGADLEHARHYLYSLARGAAEGTLVMPAEVVGAAVARLWLHSGGL